MTEQTAVDADQSWVSHLVELRNRVLRAVIALLVVFVALSFIANDIYEVFAAPLMQALPEGASMISTEPHGPFFVPFKLAFFVSLMLILPYLFYQIWGFIAPALYAHEKKLIFPLIASSTLLFYLGVLFAYFIVFPLIFAFFAASAPEGVAVMTDISAYMSFAMKLFFAFGVAFEVPVATILLAKTGAVSPEAMEEKRPYIIVGAFIAGMLMTPPDIFSQLFLAIPVWLLFEVGLFFSKRMIAAKKEKEKAETENGELDD
jgi:sec-independent protein translocase protein TatC